MSTWTARWPSARRSPVSRVAIDSEPALPTTSSRWSPAAGKPRGRIQLSSAMPSTPLANRRSAQLASSTGNPWSRRSPHFDSAVTRSTSLPASQRITS